VAGVVLQVQVVIILCGWWWGEWESESRGTRPGTTDTEWRRHESLGRGPTGRTPCTCTPATVTYVQFDCQDGALYQCTVLFTTLVSCLVDLLDRWFRITFQVSHSWDT